VAILALLPALALSWSAPTDDTAATAITLVVDANSAPPEVLLALPRLGPVLVGRIVEARRSRPFESLEDLDARVRGIGPVTVNALRPFLRFDAPARIELAAAAPKSLIPTGRQTDSRADPLRTGAIVPSGMSGHRPSALP
jgi:competence protein ComEA